MDINEAKSYAEVYVIEALMTGKNFKDLDQLARRLVLMISAPAKENAEFINKYSARTPQAMQKMEDTVARTFVRAVTGLGNQKMTVSEATHQLVDMVWEAYLQWHCSATGARVRFSPLDN